LLARRRAIQHPLAGQIDLPLLTPAFSSKGFGFLATGKGEARRTYSELSYVLAEFGRYAETSALVSAYDLHHRHFEAPELKENTVASYLTKCRIVLLDSGGYELNSDFDSTEIKTFTYSPKPGFGASEYQNVLKEWSGSKNSLHLVIANFDHDNRGRPLISQIEEARELFGRYPNILNDFILKPLTKDGRIVDPTKMCGKDFEELRGFSIIGVTEKELGTNIIDRIKRIAYLRRGLDEAGVLAPIHVWGGLDPVSTPLLFFAGAEIFDGVSWLRYAYRNGVAIARESYAVLEPKIGIASSSQLNQALICLDNLRFLDNLAVCLQQWVDFEGENFSMFDPMIAEHLKNAYAVMKTKEKLL